MALQEPPEIPEPGTKQVPLPRNVKLLGWASFWNDVASEMIAPFLAIFLNGIGGGKQILGLIEGVADALSSLLKLFAGAWSDRLGSRKGLIVFGYALPALLRPLLGVVGVWWQVFLIRCGDRVGKGMRTAARDALIADSTPAPQRGYAFGFHRAMDHLGAAIGPLIALAFLWAFPESLRTLFVLTLIPGIIVTVLVTFGLQEQRRIDDAPEPFRFQIRAMGSSFWWYLTTLCIFTLGCSSDLFLLTRLSELGVADHWLPVIWCVFHLIKSYGNVMVGRWTGRITPRWLILGGWLVYAAIYLFMGWVHSPWLAIAAMLVYGGYYALTEPPERALVAQLVPVHLKGQGFGWFHLVTGLTVLPANILFGMLYHYFGAPIAFGTGAGLALAAAGLLAFLRIKPQSV